MMLSTTSFAQDDVPKLAAALQRAETRIRALEQENSALRTEIRWIDQLLAVPASIMSPSHKVTLHAAVKAYQQGTPDEHGLVQIESWKLCKSVGQSKQTFLDNLTYCTEKLGILTKKRERIVESGTNDYSTNLYIGVTPLLADPHQYKVETPRNHGGERQLCPHCKSDRLQRKVIVTCMNCGSILEEKINLVNQGSHLDDSPASQGDQAEHVHMQDDRESASESTINLTSFKTNVLEGQRDDSASSPPEPATPPLSDGDSNVQAAYLSSSQQPKMQHAGCMTATLSQSDLLAQAAHLLVEIAGPEPAHIEMSARGPKKYYDVKRAITERDTRAHLKGWKTKGAYLRRPDGMTRALCYDADTSDDWEALLDGARLLSEAGYLLIVEDSPAGRGGHLWIIYTRLVSAPAAQRHALQVAPMLQHIKESWPGAGPNKVRLPGGKYVKPGFAAWCKLHDAHGARIAEDGQGAAQVLLDYQTPAEILGDEVSPPDGPQRTGSLACRAALAATEPWPCGPSVAHTGEFAALPNNNALHHADPVHVQEEKRNGCAHRNALGVDRQWQQKYSHHLWFQFTPEQLAAWYNERHKVENILPPEKNGMGLACWRGEHTASVGLRESGWVDFGVCARRSDGKPDGGDALELTVRITEETKPEVMRQIARQLVCEARAALESAARKSEPPPPWVQAFMSPAGWERYQQMREEAVHVDLMIANEPEPAPPAGGVAGFHPLSASHSVPLESNPVREIREALAAEMGATVGALCERCGCAFQRTMAEYQVCVRCFPQRGYHHFAERVDQLYPRRNLPMFGMEI